MGEIITAGSIWAALPLALLAGLVSFASPCVLPLVPGYLGYLTGTTTTAGVSRWRALAGTGLFTLGFSVLFIGYGAAFGALGVWLIRWQDLLTRILGIVVLLMGLVFLGVFRLLQRTAKPAIHPPSGLAGAPLLGIAFGLGTAGSRIAGLGCGRPSLTSPTIMSAPPPAPRAGSSGASTVPDAPGARCSRTARMSRSVMVRGPPGPVASSTGYSATVK